MTPPILTLTYPHSDEKGEDTALELAICPPTLGDDTNLEAINSTMETTEGGPRDFVQENMKVNVKKKIQDRKANLVAGDQERADRSEFSCFQRCSAQS